MFGGWMLRVGKAGPADNRYIPPAAHPPSIVASVPAARSGPAQKPTASAHICPTQAAAGTTIDASRPAPR